MARVPIPSFPGAVSLSCFSAAAWLAGWWPGLAAFRCFGCLIGDKGQEKKTRGGSGVLWAGGGGGGGG